MHLDFEGIKGMEANGNGGNASRRQFIHKVKALLWPHGKIASRRPPEGLQKITVYNVVKRESRRRVCAVCCQMLNYFTCI